MNASGSLPGEGYNAAADLIGRNLPDRADKTAVIDAAGRYSYAELARRVRAAAAAFRALGLQPGDRLALALLDGIDFTASFLGAIWAGAVPIPLNTMLPAEDYAYILTDSDARMLVVSEPLLPQIGEAIGQSGWRGELIVSGRDRRPDHRNLSLLLDEAVSAPEPHRGRPEDIGFWLYSSGSTGRPKGTLHRQVSLAATGELFGRQTLGLQAEDIVFSAAKLFFAYGLGNALTFPLAAGATAVLFPDRVTPEVVARLLAEHRVSVFCGVPTLFASILASPHVPDPEGPLRICLSAGEALPEGVGRAWCARTGVDIVDGIGSTEMLHIFVSNRPGAVRYGVTGYPAPGYEAEVRDDQGSPCPPGEVGELFVRGPSMTAGYWNQPEKTAALFRDGWMKTGDKFILHDDGSLAYCGRADDMLKVSGMWVSPVEVEAALIAHDSVIEAAVIGVTDPAGLMRTKAFIVARPGVEAGSDLAEELKSFVKSRLAPHKYPRDIAFVDALPKTATGKVRRHVLREAEASLEIAGTAP